MNIIPLTGLATPPAPPRILDPNTFEALWFAPLLIRADALSEPGVIKFLLAKAAPSRKGGRGSALADSIGGVAYIDSRHDPAPEVQS